MDQIVGIHQHIGNQNMMNHMLIMQIIKEKVGKWKVGVGFMRVRKILILLGLELHILEANDLYWKFYVIN